MHGQANIKLMRRVYGKSDLHVNWTSTVALDNKSRGRNRPWFSTHWFSISGCGTFWKINDVLQTLKTNVRAFQANYLYVLKLEAPVQWGKVGARCHSRGSVRCHVFYLPHLHHRFEWFQQRTGYQQRKPGQCPQHIWLGRRRHKLGDNIIIHHFHHADRW